MNKMATPAAKIDAYFPIVATIWKNEGKEGRAWYSATVERRYRGEDGLYQNTSSFSGDELLAAGKALNDAHTEIARLRANDRTAQQRTSGEGG